MKATVVRISLQSVAPTKSVLVYMLHSLEKIARSCSIYGCIVIVLHSLQLRKIMAVDYLYEYKRKRGFKYVSVKLFKISSKHSSFQKFALKMFFKYVENLVR